MFILYCYGNSNFHTLSFLFEFHTDCAPYWWSNGEAKILGAKFLHASWGRRLGGHRGWTVTEIEKEEIKLVDISFNLKLKKLFSFEQTF